MWTAAMGRDHASHRRGLFRARGERRRHAYEVSCAMAQIYNEQVEDLVAVRVSRDSAAMGRDGRSSTCVGRRGSARRRRVLNRGRQRLVYAETQMNKQS